MSRTHTKFNDAKNARRVKILKRGLIISIVSMAIALVLLALLGNAFWPASLLFLRPLLIAILAFLVIFLSLMSPVIISFTKDPRPLSGPGKHPGFPKWWQ
jgi:Na+-transporting methylmalonyl-CoA/oxaloacetate decarboxylase gamma subunit